MHQLARKASFQAVPSWFTINSYNLVMITLYINTTHDKMKTTISSAINQHSQNFLEPGLIYIIFQGDYYLLVHQWQILVQRRAVLERNAPLPPC